jgi:hypothetical protein
MEIFLFSTASRTALSQPTSYSMGSGYFYPGIKRPEREADHSPPSSFKVNNAQNYSSTPTYIFMALCLVKRRDTFSLLSTTYYIVKYHR